MTDLKMESMETVELTDLREVGLTGVMNWSRREEWRKSCSGETLLIHT